MDIKKDVTVYVSGDISSPFLSGVFNPRIVLPGVKFSAEELRHIFRHELTHWKSRHALLKLFALLVNAVHWFNPLAYMLRRDVNRFCELYCDETVVSAMDRGEKKRYCGLILKTLWREADCRARLYTAFGGEKQNITRRIDMIMGNGKRRFRISAAVVTATLILVGVVVTYVLLGNGKTDKQETKTSAYAASAAEEEEGRTLFVTYQENELLADAPITVTFSDENEESAFSVKENDDTIGLLSGDMEEPVDMSSSIDWSIPAHSATASFKQMTLDEGGNITINIAYTPIAAKISIGIVQPDGVYRYVDGAAGIASYTFPITQEGAHGVRIKNNSGYAASVTGFATATH
jgi:hypothetical protein